MKEILYTDFKGIDDVISSLINNDTMLQKAMRRSTLYKFWSKVVGKPFDEKSKPHGMIGGTTMVVACENSAVVQELTLRKRQIIKKFAPYIKALKIEIKDIVLDAKKWENTEN